MKTLFNVMVPSLAETTKEASKLTLMQKMYYPLALGGVATMIGKEVVAPFVDNLARLGDHDRTLSRIQANYPASQRAMVKEVFGVLTHTAPHMARNYLIAKTLVDQKMAVMEQLSGSHPKGMQIPLPTLEQAINMEKGVQGGTAARPGSLEDVATKALAEIGKTGIGKNSSDPTAEEAWGLAWIKEASSGETVLDRKTVAAEQSGGPTAAYEQFLADLI
jgi:hypothetical protein